MTSPLDLSHSRNVWQLTSWPPTVGGEELARLLGEGDPVAPLSLFAVQSTISLEVDQISRDTVENVPKLYK